MSIKQLLLLLPLVACPHFSQAQSSGLKIIKTFHIKSGGGWDFIAVSPLTDAIYISHGTQVNILNKTTGDSLGIISGTTGVHGIVFAPEFNKGFISNGKLGNVFVFDAKTNRILDSIRTGDNPDAMCYDAHSGRLVVGNGRSKDATIIDASTNKVLATVPLGGKPEVGVSDEAGRVFINIEDKNEVVVLDIHSMKIITRYPLAGGDEPSGIAYNKKAGLLFVGCGNKKLIVLDAATGRQKAILPIGDHCDGVVEDGGVAYASNGDGTLSIIRPAKAGYKTKTLQTKQGAKTIALDPDTHLVYLPTADFEPQANPKERLKMIHGTFEILVVGGSK